MGFFTGSVANKRAGRSSCRRRHQQVVSAIQMLEQRLFLHGHVAPASLLDVNGNVVHDADAVAMTMLDNAQAASTKLPLSSLPVLSSDSGAKATIYLDFVGAPAMTWETYSVPTTPAFDQDGDPTTFTSSELTSITQIWQSVSEMYSPFNINVTTVPPASLVHGQNMELVIGGSDAWLGASAGGVSYISAFAASYLPNISFVFPAQLANGTPKYTAEATAHEAGHEFGLYHQAVWSGTTLVQDYNPGTANNGPIMGDPYGDNRALWYDGVNDVSSTTIQDDMGVISNATNGFGYRSDGVSHTLTAPTALTGSSLSATGIFSSTSQVDYYSFTTGGGSISLSASQFSIPGVFNGMLSLKFSLYDSNDQLVTSSGSGLSESINTTVTAGTYTVAISSDGSYGDVGQYTFSGTVIAPPPAAPSGLGAAAAGTSSINLSWSDSAGDETGFYVERSPDDATWGQIGSTTSTSYQDTGLNSGTTYYYRVRAYNGNGDSAYTSVASATTQTAIPAAPTTLAATATSTSAIALNWTDNSSNESGFYVERSSDDSTWTQIASVGANVSRYNDTGLSSSTTYYYRVRAYNAGGDSAYTNVFSATTQTPAPSMPENFNANALSTSEIDLSWTDNSNQTGFYVERSPDDSTWAQIGETTSTTYQDTGLPQGTTYYYRVRAYNSGGNSVYASAVSATTLAPLPAAPSGLGATAVNVAEIDLEWTNNDETATGIYIERSPDNSTWSQIGSVPGGTSSYNDTGLNIGATYFYRVRAYNTYGDSAYSDTSSAVAFPLIAPPIPAQDVTAAPISCSNVTLNWVPSPGATGFLVQRSQNRSNWSTLAQLPADSSSYQDSTADSGTRYFYQVIAFNSAGDAPASNLAPTATPLFTSILDDDSAAGTVVSGPWSHSTSVAGYFGSDFLQDNNTNKGLASVTFTPTLAANGNYLVMMRWTSAPNRADNVPVTVSYNGGSVNLHVNERHAGGIWVMLGIFSFQAGSAGSVTISNAGTDGVVVANAVEFVQFNGYLAASYRLSASPLVSSAPIMQLSVNMDPLLEPVKNDSVL